MMIARIKPNPTPDGKRPRQQIEVYVDPGSAPEEVLQELKEGLYLLSKVSGDDGPEFKMVILTQLGDKVRPLTKERRTELGSLPGGRSWWSSVAFVCGLFGGLIWILLNAALYGMITWAILKK